MNHTDGEFDGEENELQHTVVAHKGAEREVHGAVGLQRGVLLLRSQAVQPRYHAMGQDGSAVREVLRHQPVCVLRE